MIDHHPIVRQNQSCLWILLPDPEHWNSSVLILDLRFHSLVTLDELHYRLSFQDAVLFKTFSETSRTEFVSKIYFDKIFTQIWICITFTLNELLNWKYNNKIGRLLLRQFCTITSLGQGAVKVLHRVGISHQFWTISAGNINGYINRSISF